MALKQSSSPPPPNTQTAAQPPTLPASLPPAHLFDILPALHEVLSRIDHAPTTNAAAALLPDLTGADEDHHTTFTYTGSQPLDPKDLPAAILPIKALMRRALRELEVLPDMERTVQEQEEEIAELEEKVDRQKEVLAGLGARAGEVLARLGIGDG